ncbi:MAG: hypothetical protein QNJ38_11115 [Prochloraceae cyanobacterium]|nr:hypothetical protein [Prochloraceae cyanobacterium]
MLASIHYLIRSKQDGQYLVARVKNSPEEAKPARYLLIFTEQYDALSYLNAHAKQMSDRFAVESLAGTQLKTLLKRWGFEGVGLVRDPLVPEIDFMLKDSTNYF